MKYSIIVTDADGRCETVRQNLTSLSQACNDALEWADTLSLDASVQHINSAKRVDIVSATNQIELSLALPIEMPCNLKS